MQSYSFSKRIIFIIVLEICTGEGLMQWYDAVVIRLFPGKYLRYTVAIKCLQTNISMLIFFHEFQRKAVHVLNSSGTIFDMLQDTSIPIASIKLGIF